MRPNLKDLRGRHAVRRDRPVVCRQCLARAADRPRLRDGAGLLPDPARLAPDRIRPCDRPCRAAQAGGIRSARCRGAASASSPRRSCSLPLTVRGLGVAPALGGATMLAALSTARNSIRLRARAQPLPHVFCVLLFVYACNCRTPSSAHGSAAENGADRQSGARPCDRAVAAEPVLLLRRRAGRHLHRRAARHRPDRDDRDAAAAHLLPDAGLLADHARRHLLRLAIWRLHHGDPDQPAGRSVVLGHGDRRLPDGAAGAGRAGARHRGDRLVHRRHLRDLRDRDRRGAADRASR